MKSTFQTSSTEDLSFGSFKLFTMSAVISFITAKPFPFKNLLLVRSFIFVLFETNFTITTLHCPCKKMSCSGQPRPAWAGLTWPRPAWPCHSWPGPAQARKLAWPSMALAGPGWLRLANFNFLWLFTGLGRPRAAQASQAQASQAQARPVILTLHNVERPQGLNTCRNTYNVQNYRLLNNIFKYVNNIFCILNPLSTKGECPMINFPKSTSVCGNSMEL